MTKRTFEYRAPPIHPANAARLLEALARALKGGGQMMTLEELAARVSLDE